MFPKIYIRFFPLKSFRTNIIYVLLISLGSLAAPRLKPCFGQTSPDNEEKTPSSGIPDPLKPHFKIFRVFNSKDLYARIQLAYHLAHKNNRNFREYLNLYLVSPVEKKAAFLEDALCMSIKLKNLELFKYLVRHYNADIYMQDNLPLRWIAMNGQADFVRFILDIGDFSQDMLQNALGWARFGENWTAFKIILQQKEENAARTP